MNVANYFSHQLLFFSVDFNFMLSLRVGYAAMGKIMQGCICHHGSRQKNTDSFVQKIGKILCTQWQRKNIFILRECQ